MHSTQRLAAGPDYTIDDILFHVDTPSWTAPEAGRSYRLVLVRRGAYRLRWRSREMLVDPATVYAVEAGDEQSIAHRVGARDAATSIKLSPRMLAEVTGDRRPPAGLLRTHGRLDLAHRCLVARARAGADDFELTDSLLRLADGLMNSQCDAEPASREKSSAARTRIVAKAREALADDPISLGLDQLAATANVSAAYLSRVFHRETGETLTRFRHRLRVRRALDRLEEGERSLSRLAVELGFSDHAHFTRTVRAELGHSPSAIRDMLAQPRIA